jgi:hypothetical protein
LTESDGNFEASEAMQKIRGWQFDSSPLNKFRPTSIVGQLGVFLDRQELFFDGRHRVASGSGIQRISSHF